MPHRMPTGAEMRRAPGARKPPGPGPLSSLNSVLALGRDPIRFALDMWHRYGDLVRIRFLFWQGYLVFHPDQIKHILQDNHRNYTKDFFTLNAFKAFVGNGLVTNNGDSWLQQRRLMQPAFHRKRLAAFGTLITGTTVEMIERWQGFAEQGQPLDIAGEMMRLTLRIVGRSLFSIDLSNETETVGRAVTTLSTLMVEYMSVPFPPLWIPTPRNRRITSAIRTLDTVVQDIITARRRQHTESGDLLSLLLSARDEETGERMSDKQVRDEVMTLLFAGHETTSNLLAWTWYVLSQHPEVERRLHAELEAVLAGQRPSVEHLTNLPYSQMVLEETLRLYPPAWSLARKARARDCVGGYAIPAKSVILMIPYVTHRHPAFWEHPEWFDPERFTPECAVARPRYAYYPFGGGPRQCIGNNFALMEAHLILATVAQRYRLHLVPGHEVEAEALLTLRPRYGLPMILKPVEHLHLW
jgi:cytochrome P450